MRSFYFIVLVFLAAVLVTYWYQSTANMCPTPIAYRLGDIDESFDLSPVDAKQYVLEAENYWEEATGRDLFNYDEEAIFTVDFIFDERQMSANSEENQRDDLDIKKEESDLVMAAVENLRGEHESLTERYRNDVSVYEDKLSKYNAEVNKYNDRGGAPSDVFEELENERNSLSGESFRLTEKATELNKLVDEINELNDKGNKLVEKYNREVNEYNEEFGFVREFTQGDYHEGNIRIYKFTSKTELIIVLAHEFGHALGISHVEGDTSLMYYLLVDTESLPVLSNEDLVAFNEVCGKDETLQQKLRRIIRELLVLQ